MRILGIDPGYDRCGYAVIERLNAQQFELLDSGSLTTTRGNGLAARLHELAGKLDTVLQLWQPQVVAIEEIFFAKNVKTAIGVAQARGVVLERSAAGGHDIAEYTPTSIKSQLTGNGQADKQQVAFMVRRWFRMDDSKRLDDELDAIAVGLCHCQRADIPEVLK